jgi:hypothetical protein
MYYRYGNSSSSSSSSSCSGRIRFDSYSLYPQNEKWPVTYPGYIKTLRIPSKGTAI